MTATLTEQSAIEYVKRIEASWSQAGDFIATEVSTYDGFPVINVKTADNDWTVWIEHGAIYGEC